MGPPLLDGRHHAHKTQIICSANRMGKMKRTQTCRYLSVLIDVSPRQSFRMTPNDIPAAIAAGIFALFSGSRTHPHYIIVLAKQSQSATWAASLTIENLPYHEPNLLIIINLSVVPKQTDSFSTLISPWCRRLLFVFYWSATPPVVGEERPDLLLLRPAQQQQVPHGNSTTTSNWRHHYHP
jgi:hypothetical protein